MKEKNTQRKIRKIIQSNKGLSLPELLGVIAILGIIGSIAFGVVTGATDAATNRKGEQNADEMTRLYHSALTSGATVSDPATNVGNAITDLESGVTAGGITFRLRNQVTNASYTWNAGDARFAFTANATP